MNRKRLLRTAFWVLVGLLALVTIISVWTLATASGARWLLRRADAAMPASLTVGKLEGSLLRGLLVDGFAFEDDGVRLDARRLEVDLRVLPLLAKRVHVNRIFVDGARLRLWPAQKADEPYMAMQLPVRLRLDEVLANDLVIEGLTEETLLLDTLAFAGTWVDTHVELERLVIQAPNGRLAFRGDIDLANLLALEGRGTLSWQVDGVAWRAALATRRHPTGTGVGLTVTAPLTAEVTALLAGDHSDPRWQARVRVPTQTLPASLTGGEPTRAALLIRGGGVGLDARVTGSGEYDGERFELADVRLRSTPATVFVDALELSLPDREARLAISGKIDRGGKQPDAELRIDLERLALPQGDGAPTVLAGRVDLRGWLQQFSAVAALTAVRKSPRGDASASLSARVQGTPDRIDIESLRIVSDQGEAVLSGEIGIAPGARWELRGRAERFDPSIFASAWPGSIDARLAFDGKRGETQPVGALVIDGIGGTLRGRAIAGEAALTLGEKGLFAGSGNVRSGDSRIAFDKPALDDPRIALDVDVRSLADLLPNARGQVQGKLTLDIAESPPSVDGSLTASDIAIDTIAVGLLELDARAPRTGGAGHLTLVAESLAIDRLLFERVALEVDGTVARHVASLSVESIELDASVEAQGSFVEEGWRGRLSKFELAPRDLAPWTLREPVAVVASSSVFSIADPGICVTTEGRDSCIDAGWSREGDLAMQWNIDRLPSAAIARALELAGIATLEIDSALSSQGTFVRTSDGLLRGGGSASLSDGRIVIRRAQDPIVVAIRDLRLDASADAAGVRVRLGGVVNESGRIAGDLSLGPEFAPGSALSGDIALEFDELSWLEALSPDIANSRGRFSGRFTLAGTLGAPRYSGEARLTDFFVEIPEYNLRLREGDVRVTASADRSMTVTGTVLSGRDGSARIEGRIAPDAKDGERLRLRITGDNFLAANRPDLMLRVTPDVTIAVGAERIDIEGTVTVPRARIDLSRVEGGGRRSADVIVVDDPAVERNDLPVWTDLTVVAGDQVELEGFGLDGKVSGSLRIRNRPGREATGQGTLNVTGKYAAYAQRLDITRGRVVFNRTALDNPQLDIRATRRVGTITVGIRVGGTARVPESEVFSSPAMDQSDALAYLVIGRPLRSANRADAGAIANAAGALGGPSGDLLSSSLGARMGLGDLGEPTSAFTLGRWLSPRLYLSYGIAGLSGEPVFSLRYLLREWLELETVLGTEVRAGINYRRER